LNQGTGITTTGLNAITTIIAVYIIKFPHLSPSDAIVGATAQKGQPAGFAFGGSVQFASRHSLQTTAAQSRRATQRWVVAATCHRVFPYVICGLNYGALHI